MEELFNINKQLHGLNDAEKKAFMAGASAVLEYLNREVSVMEEEDAIDQFAALQKQCDDYFYNHS